MTIVGIATVLPAPVEFDVWKSDDNRWTATVAAKRLVDDGDAPYSFHTHVQRLSARTIRSAVQAARSAFKASCRH